MALPKLAPAMAICSKKVSAKVWPASSRTSQPAATTQRTPISMSSRDRL
jgi:hypothetical protein